MKMFRVVVVALVSILSFSACSFLALIPIKVTVPAKIYNLDTGDVFPGTFTWDKTGYGPIEATSDKGIHCSGEYSTQVGGYSGTSAGTSRSWGHIYGWGAGGFAGGPVRSYGSSSESYSVTPNTQAGSAILSCDDKNIIQCEYVVNVGSKHGDGYCTDNKKSRYKFTF